MLLALAFVACENSNIKMIKEGFLDIDKSVNIGYALDSYKDCASLSYEAIEKDGKSYVVAKCDVSEMMKKELNNDYAHYTNINYVMTANLLEKFIKNLDLFDSFDQSFVFLINQDKSYHLEQIELNAFLKDGKKITLYATNPKRFMELIYKNKTLIENKGISNYVAYFNAFASHTDELKKTFGLDIKNPLAFNERINAMQPFGLIINQTTLQEAYKIIPCSFEESKFIDGIFEKKGYYIEYSNCSLTEGMGNLELGFDDNQKLIMINVKFNKENRKFGSDYAIKIKEKLKKENLISIPVNENTFFSKRFKFEVPNTNVIIDRQNIRFDTYLEYADKDFYSKRNEVLAKKDKKIRFNQKYLKFLQL